MASKSVPWILLACVLASLACERAKDAPQIQAAPAPAASAASEPLNLPPDSGLPQAFDG